MLTPYGATEALRVTVIASPEILGEPRARTDEGTGSASADLSPRW